MSVVKPLFACRTAKAAVGTWGNGVLTSVVRQNGVAHPQRPLPTGLVRRSAVGVPAGVRPEDALCDFAKMVFTDPS